MSPLPLILESKNFSGSLSPILLQGPGFLLSLFLSEEILLDLQHPGEAVHQGGFSTALFSSLTRLPPPLSIGFSRSGSQSFVCFNSRVLHICLPFCHPTHTHMLFPCHHTRGSSTQAFCIILQPRIWVNKEAFPLHFPPGPHWFTQTGGVTPCSWVILEPLLQHFELTLYQQPKEPLCKVQLGSDEPMLKENEKEIQRLCKADMLFVFIDFLCGCSAVQWRCGTFPEQAGLTHVTWLGHIFEPCDARGDGDIATLHGKANLVCFSSEPGWGRGVPAWDNVWWQPGLTVMCLTHVTDQLQMCEKCCSPHHQKIHLQQPDGAVRPWMITNCTSIWFRLRSTQAWDLPWAHLSPVKPGRLL